MEKFKTLILLGFFNIFFTITTAVDASNISISGRVSTTNNSPVCAMVLANGVNSFSCDGNGNFYLNEAPVDASGTVTLFSWAEGFSPYKIIFTPSSSSERHDITMTQSSCTGTGSDLGGNSSGVQQITLSGKVYLQGTNTALCAMVLANGKSMFSCDGSGDFLLQGVSVDISGSITLFAWADGFLQHKSIFKPSSAQEYHDINMKASQGCSTPSSYLLTVNTSGSGDGTVSGGGIYKAGDFVRLDAIPDSGSRFGDWNPYPCAFSFAMPAKNLTCTATFNQISQSSPTYMVMLAKSGTGTGTVSGGGNYHVGDLVYLSAIPDNGSDFDGWSPSPCAASFTMLARNINCTATFNQISQPKPITKPTYTVTLTQSGSGTVSGGGSYKEGDLVTLTATATGSCSIFAGWSPSPCASNFTMPTHNLTCNASFLPKPSCNIRPLW